MKGILSVSHGRLAEGLLDTLQISCGELQQMQTPYLLPGEGATEFTEKLEATIQEVDIGEGVIIFCDLLSGPLCNCNAKLLQDAKHMGRIGVMTGVNLCMVLEYIGPGAADMDREALADIGRKGIVDLNKPLKERQAT